MRWLTNFYDFRFKGTATEGIGIHPTKAWLSRLVNLKNVIWTWRYFRRTVCNEILFSTWKKCRRNVWNASLCFSTILQESASVFVWHKRFKEGRSSVMDDERCGRSKEIKAHQYWLAKGFGLGLLCWGFQWVQEKIPSEEASTLQIGSMAILPGQYTSPQLHPCHRQFDKDGHQDSSSPSL